MSLPPFAAPDRLPPTALLTAPLLALLSQTLLVLLPLSMILAFACARPGSARVASWPLWLVLLVLAVINTQKLPESDLADYYRFVDHVVATPLWDVFATDESFISVRPSEFVFKAFVSLLSPLGAAARIAFTLLSTLLLYGACVAGAHRFIDGLSAGAKPMVQERLLRALILAAALLLGVTFSVTAHLTRQYLAGAVFFSGLFGFLFTGRHRWLLLCAGSAGVHGASAILLLPLGAMLLHRRFPRWAMAFVCGIAVAGLFNPLLLLTDIELQATLFGEEGQQPPLLMLLDASLVLGAWWIGAHRPRSPRDRGPAALDGLRHAAEGVLVFGIAFAAVLFAVREVPLVMFRSYFFLEFVRAPLLALVFFAALRRLTTLRLPAALVLLIVSAAACWARTAGADWQYTSDGLLPMQLPDLMRRWQTIENS